MRQTSRNFDFLQKAGGANRCSHVWLKDLKGNASVMLEVLGQKNNGHPATAEFALQTVSVSESGRKTRWWVDVRIHETVPLCS